MGKLSTWIAVMFALGVVGCGQSQSSGDGGEQGATSTGQQTEGGSNPLNAPGEYVDAVVGSKDRAETAIGLSSIQRALKSFQAGEGRMPKSLDELVSEGYIAKLPSAPNGMEFQYNPKTGQIQTVQQ